MRKLPLYVLLSILMVGISRPDCIAQGQPDQTDPQKREEKPQSDPQRAAYEKFEKTHKELLDKSGFFAGLQKDGLLDKAKVSDGPPPTLQFSVQVDGKPAKLMLVLGAPPQKEQLILMLEGGGSAALPPDKNGAGQAKNISSSVKTFRAGGVPDESASQGMQVGDVSGAETGRERENAMTMADGIAAGLKSYVPQDTLAASALSGNARSGAADAERPDRKKAAAAPSPDPRQPRVSVSQLPKSLASDVPGMAADGKKPPPAAAAPASAGLSREAKEVLWSAIGKFMPALSASRMREIKQNTAADAKASWLERKKADFMSLAGKAAGPEEKAKFLKTAGGIEKLMSRRDAALALENPDQRSAALGEWGESVSHLMGKSREGAAEKAILDRRAALDSAYGALKTDAGRQAWINEHGKEYDLTGKKLTAFYEGNPEYLAARKTEADAQFFARSHMKDFRDGTKFTAGELGLALPAGQKVTISRSPAGALSGARGVAYTDDKGFAHFQSFDDRVRVNEVASPSGGKMEVEQRLSADGTLNISEKRADGALMRTEERRPDGTLAVEMYGAGGKAVASLLQKPDGSREETGVIGDSALKRTIRTSAAGAGTFTVEPVSGGAYPKQSGRVVDGRLVTDRIESGPGQETTRVDDYLFEKRTGGKAAGYEVDMAAIQGLPEEKRASAVAAAASMMAGGRAAQTGPLAQFISNVGRQAGPGDQVALVTGRDKNGATVYQAEMTGTDGSRRQVLGQWAKLSARESAGLASDVGLDVSVRSAGGREDINSLQYLKLFRYSGADVTDRYSSASRITGNWFVGYGVKEDNYAGRYISGTDNQIRKIYVGSQSLYSSPSIIGQTGAALNTMGKGTVQLSASAMALAGAGTIGWADRNLQNELLLRSQANFFGNEVSRSLGKNYIGPYYNDGYARLGINEDRNIQNVGREMSGMGQPVLGAVLQGGVEFSNGVATTLILAPVGGQGFSKGMEKAGTAGIVVSKTLGAYRSIKYAGDTVASGVEFASAHRAFNENDPASKARYYSAVTNLTAQALWSPATVSGVIRTADTARQLKGVFTDKPSVISGADGSPYQKPPAELSGLGKFVLGKTGPGVITNVMTKDIGMGMDPVLKINLSDNPAARAVGSMDKWIASQVDQWAGR